jgi:hypothetical protein
MNRLFYWDRWRHSWPVEIEGVQDWIRLYVEPVWGWKRLVNGHGQPSFACPSPEAVQRGSKHAPSLSHFETETQRCPVRPP